MKEQLNNISRELQEISNKELTQQEKRENEQLYKKELKREIKGTIEQEIEKQLEEGEALNNIYNFLIVNDDTIKENIFRTLENYTIKIKRIKPAPEYANESKNKKEFIYLVNYPFKCFDIGEDIEDNFYKILKSVINKYNLKNNISNEEIKEEVKNYLLKIYNLYGYRIAKQTLYNEENKIAVSKGADQQHQQYILQNYYKWLNEVDKVYKITHSSEIEQQKELERLQKRQTTQKTKLQKHKKSFFLGSIVCGLLSGLYKASK